MIEIHNIYPCLLAFAQLSKTVRLRVREIEPLLSDDQLNLKIVVLVRNHTYCLISKSNLYTVLTKKYVKSIARYLKTIKNMLLFMF